MDVSVANEAVSTVLGDRQDSYGDARENLGRIAALWSAYLGIEVKPSEVAAMMNLVKISRSKNTYKRDNAVDGVGYWLIQDSLARYE